MNETRKLLDTVKRCLRSRGMTYRDLGRSLGLSESSVKRLFADESFTLARLEKVCAVLEMTMADLVQMSAGPSEARAAAHTLTLEQERTLASNASLLACFYLLLNGRSPQDVERQLGASPTAMRGMLERLQATHLLEITAKRTVRLHAKLPIAWRPAGPVRRLYERQVRAEFLQSAFDGSHEALTFHSAELSPASVRILLRKIERLATDFAELAALDMSLAARDKSSVGVLLACRPWVFSMFSAYRTQAKGAVR